MLYARGSSLDKDPPPATIVSRFSIQQANILRHTGPFSGTRDIYVTSYIVCMSTSNSLCILGTILDYKGCSVQWLKTFLWIDLSNITEREKQALSRILSLKIDRPKNWINFVTQKQYNILYIPHILVIDLCILFNFLKLYNSKKYKNTIRFSLWIPLSVSK